MSKFSKISLDGSGRVELKEKLGLSSCEVSFNKLEAGAAVPFFHAHKENEEVYLFLAGEGVFELDGERLEVKAGDVVRVAPPVMRKINAKSALEFVCIQAKENSLTQWSATDGILG